MSLRLTKFSAINPWHVESGGIVFQLSIYVLQKFELAKRNILAQMSSEKQSSVVDDDKEKLREIPCEESEMLASNHYFLFPRVAES